MMLQRIMFPIIHLAVVALSLAGCNLPADTPAATVVPITFMPLPTATPTLLTPLPTATSTPLPTATLLPPTPIPSTPTCNYDMGFVADVTIPDNMVILPGQGFVKTWRIVNNGNCPWPAGTMWSFADGTQMGGPGEVPVPATSPGATVDVSVNLIAPGAPGTYTGYWTLRLPDGRILSQRIFARIVVPSPTSPPLPPQPLVMLMDGALEILVYNRETFDAGGTNADDIASILAVLPIETRKVTTSLDWAGEQDILQQDPELIIIHTSAFLDPNADSRQVEEKTISFFRFMADSPVKFLIYSRSPTFRDEAFARMRYESIDPLLQGRVDVLYVPMRWDRDGVAENLENKVKSILQLN